MLKKIISKFQEDKSALAEFKEKILKEKTKIEEELENLKNPEMDEFVHLPSFGDGDDLSDEADQLEDMGNALAVRQVLEKKLEAINESLDRIKKENTVFVTDVEEK